MAQHQTDRKSCIYEKILLDKQQTPLNIAHEANSTNKVLHNGLFSFVITLLTKKKKKRDDLFSNVLHEGKLPRRKREVQVLMISEMCASGMVVCYLDSV